VGAQRLASSAFSSVGWQHCLRRMAVVDILGSGERLVLWVCVGQGGVGSRSGGSAPDRLAWSARPVVMVGQAVPVRWWWSGCGGAAPFTPC
jgi:hypothetical protein